MPLRNNDCHVPMDGEGTDAQITSGNEVRKRHGQVETSQFRRVYFNVPNALRDETHLTYAEPCILPYGGPDGLRCVSCDFVAPPVSCGETKTEQASSTPKSNGKTSLRKADEPSSLSQPPPSPKTLETPSLLPN